MVKKLFKHEILSYTRVLPLMYIILCGIALFSRMLQFFDIEGDSFVAQSYRSLLVTSIILYVLGAIAVFALTTIFAVTRFYKNLFTGEGYLSFTLPVTPAQHIIVKAVVAVLAEIASIIAFCISLAFITAGELFTEILRGIGYEFAQLWKGFGANLPFLVLYMLIFFILSLACEILLIYACIAIGQMSNKNRILAAVGVYFGYYAAMQVLGSIGIAFLFIFASSPIAYAISDFIEANPMMSVHLLFIIAILIQALIVFAYFTVVRLVIKKKLNLE